MTCADARHRILTADLSAIRGESDASLREHLAGCSTCATDAARIIDGTARLSGLLLTRQRRPEIRRVQTRRIAMAVIPVALAAEIALIAVLSNRDRPHELQRPALDDSVVTVAARTPAGPAVDIVAESTRTPPRVVERAKPKADSKAPRRGAGDSAVADSDASMSQVRVTVGDRQRAAVIATSNPNVTVVWLSRGDTL